MNTETGYCGYDCTACLGLIAYRIEDIEEREKYLKMHSSIIPCAGCHAAGNVCDKTCSIYAMRLCGLQKDIVTCTECKDYPCILYKNN